MTRTPGSSLDAALAAWLRALETCGEAGSVGAAVEPNVEIARASGLGRHAGQVVEVISGADNVARWLALTPPSLRFSLDGPPRVSDADEHLWEVDYAVEADDFRNGGTWSLRLGPHGRIAFLRHVPRPLGEAAADEVRDTAAWRTYVAPLVPHAHDHDPHDHADHADGDSFRGER